MDMLGAIRATTCSGGLFAGILSRTYRDRADAALQMFRDVHFEPHSLQSAGARCSDKRGQRIHGYPDCRTDLLLPDLIVPDCRRSFDVLSFQEAAIPENPYNHAGAKRLFAREGAAQFQIGKLGPRLARRFLPLRAEGVREIPATIQSVPRFLASVAARFWAAVLGMGRRHQRLHQEMQYNHGLPR